MTTCKICQHPSTEAFRHQVRSKHMIAYYLCSHCGFLQTEEPFWLSEAYEQPINISDTGYVSRNIYLARRTLFLFYCLFKKTGTFLDYAGGYGLLTRLMRDYGLNFLWSDIFTPNLFAKGFEYQGQRVEAITCFECFEHFVNPIEEIEKILLLANTVFFSTKVLPSTLPSPDWDYYGFDHGQHLSFYSQRTLEFVARKYQLNYYTDGDNLHLFIKKKLPKPVFKLMLVLSRLPWEFLIKRLNGSLLERDHHQIIKTCSKQS